MKENNFDTVKNAGNKYSIENLQNKKYFKNMDEAIKVYEEFRRFKDNGFIESIDPDFFKNLTDMFLSDYKRVLKENEQLRTEVNSSKKEYETYKKQYFCLINRIENKIDKFDYEFEKAKRQNDKDKSDYYWDLIINFKKLL